MDILDNIFFNISYFVVEMVEIIVGKGECARDQQFLPFK